MRRSPSLTEVAKAAAQAAMLGPTQRQKLKGRDPAKRSVAGKLTCLAICFAIGLSCICFFWGTPVSALPALFLDTLLMRRLPATAQDNESALAAVLITLLPLAGLDVVLRAVVVRSDGPRWFLLHSIGNFIVAGAALPDFYYVAQQPAAGISVTYCKSLPFPACSDWGTCIIIAMHVYHCIGFNLNADDLFHHLFFIPIIGGLHFAYPWGASGNILCFFISGLPGAIDYAMLAAVKAGRMASMTEKRVNCSINTWLRGPGITTFCVLTAVCWLQPPSSLTMMEGQRVAPWYVVLVAEMVVFYNAQYYAQRVIGNYYIRKAQDYGKRGIKQVDLHAS